ncbi:MAG: ATP-binding protein [bacterium]|nr:ATP-binding protein [bacterium]
MLYPRDILEKIKKVIFRVEFIIISGARQTGKTSVLVMLKDFMETKGAICHYFNLENPDYLTSFNRHPFNIFEFIPEKKVKQYVFVDEIQYLDDPSRFLKLLYDERKEAVKIICSGSSSFYIDKKFRDSLVGRKFLFELFPLNFNEFLVFKGEEELSAMKGRKLTLYYKEKLKKLWLEYVTYGGYPKAVLAENEEIRKMNLEEIGSSYIKKDITDAGIRNQEKYFALLKILAGQTGQLVNAQELAGTLGVAHKTIDEYLYVVKKSYQAAFVKPFFRNFRKELVKMPKIYFYDTGLRNFFLGDFSLPSARSDKGALTENVFFKELLREAGDIDKIKFWRTQDGKEVDFVSGKSAWEIKFNFEKKKEARYGRFKEQYPDIKIKAVAFDEILEIFYGFKI